MDLVVIDDDEHEKTAISSLRKICGVSEQRARELVEAASGSVERAVEIHFGQAATVPRAARDTVDGIEEGEKVRKPMTSAKELADVKSVCNVDESRARELLEVARGSVGSAIEMHFSPAVASSKTTGTPQSGTKRPSDQSTLDTFLGLAEVKTPPKQLKLESFFTKSLPTVGRAQAQSTPENGNEIEQYSPALDGEEKPLSEKRLPSKDREGPLSENGLPYSLLTSSFEEMVATTKRNDKLEHLRDIFNSVIAFTGGVHMDKSRDEDALLLTQVIDLILGKLSVTKNTAKTNITLQVSGAAVSQAIRTVTGASRVRISEEFRRLGDLGDVAAEFFVGTSIKSFFTSTETRALGLSEVHDLIQRVATVPTGERSNKARQNLLLRLLRGCKDKNEIRFLVRTLIGNMRLGATLKSVIAALATAFNDTKKEGANVDVVQSLQNVFNICPKILDISKALLEGGVSRASQVCKLVVGFPIQPMLANPAHSLEEVEKFMGGESCVAEWKYDGVRCQAHFDGKNVKLFSRHLIENTTQYPDAVQYFLEAKTSDVQSFVCDAEIVAVAPSADAEDGYRLLPFQDLSTQRGAKDSGVSIRLYCYDLMYLNGRSMLLEPLWKRQELLQKHFSRTPGFGYASSLQMPKYDEEVLQNALAAAVTGGAEGLMIKLTGRQVVQRECDRSFGYESGNRSKLWLKLKKDYVSGSADTVDVVPIGAWFGNGRKAQAGFLSPVLLAVYDEDEDVFRSISRCMSFTDDMYRATREFYFRGKPYPPHVGLSDEKTEFAPKIDAEDVFDTPYAADGRGDETGEVVDENRVNCFASRPSSATYVTNETPSIWFKPLEVWEVSFADLTLSRVHTAAAGLVEDDQGRGVAMRFPRFIRRRPDKTVEMATTTAQIAHLFGTQSKIAGKSHSPR